MRQVPMLLILLPLAVGACGPPSGVEDDAGAGGSGMGGHPSTVGSDGGGGTSPTASGGSAGMRAAGGVSGSGGAPVLGGASGGGGRNSGGDGGGVGGDSGVAGGGIGGSGNTGGSSAGGSTGLGGAAGRSGLGGAGPGGSSGGGAGQGGHAGTNGNAGGGGGAGPGGTTGTAGASGCGVSPVTPNATQQAKNVLCYLYSQYGNHVLAGQEENATGQLADANVEVDYIFQQTGKYPAIRSFDVNNAGIATRCLSWWQSNGLCVFGYHMGAPSTSDGYTGSMTAVNGGIDSVLTVGSSNNTVFNQRLDNVVNQVMQVQSGGGVVILRLFHEAGGTWFWWSKEGGAQYVKLWNYAFDYITQTRGVKGVLWLLPYDGSPQTSFFPGVGQVDLAGADTYNAADDYSPLTSLLDSVLGIAGKTMPIALHENGPIPDPDQLQSTKTSWIWFNTWTAPYPENDTSVTELKKVYTSSYVITRDEMPSLK
ncbi:MAG TPA: glycosyl hydrolase [Polyangia bacterium]|nr:glycosyl hydrolase [Polyangia bacterium]